MSIETDFLPLAESPKATTAAAEAILWAVFTILLFCAPAIVWAVWAWAL